MYRRTGDHSIAAGIYHSECRCRSVLTVRKGDAFPVCPKCRSQVGWLFTQSVYAAKPSFPPVSKSPPREDPPRETKEPTDGGGGSPNA
jgi:hypothetical protein